MLTIGQAGFIVLILAIVSGIMKKKKMHEYFSLLTVFSFLLHFLQKQAFSTQCFLIIIFLFLTTVTGLRRFKIKKKMKLHIIFSVITIIIVIIHVFPIILPSETTVTQEGEIELPEPRLESETSLEEAILKRRSIRSYKDEDMTLEQLSQILWSAQGVTSESGKRTAPSAGMTYPLELYVLVRRVESLTPAIDQYIPEDHSLNTIKTADNFNQLIQGAVNQEVGRGSINIVISADFSRTTSTYGERGKSFVYLEAGHAAQNIYLQVAALDLGCVVVGAFDEENVKSVLSLPKEHEPIYIIPVGYPS